MSQRLRNIAWWLLLCCASGVSVAQEPYADARAWLKRMATAMNEMSYQGTFVYVRGEDVETMRITHVRDGEGVRERMYSVSGPLREIIRDHNGVRCVLDGETTILQDPMVTGSVFPDIPIEVLDQVDSRYVLRLGGTHRIAGHRGRQLTILPKDEYRYGYDLWLESKTGLLLRWVLYDADRKPLAKLMFTDIRFGGKVDEGELKSNTPSERFVPIASGMPDEKVYSGSGERPAPAGIPPGFDIAAYSRGDADRSRSYEHLVFSDGLASVSVYIEESGDRQTMKPGLSRVGTTNAWSKHAGSRSVVAIGEVPAITVKQIGNAFVAGPSAAE